MARSAAAPARPSPTPTIRLSVTLPRALAERVYLQALSTGRSVNAVVRDVLAALVGTEPL